jgi:hypothetical protein
MMTQKVLLNYNFLFLDEQIKPQKEKNMNFDNDNVMPDSKNILMNSNNLEMVHL